MADCFLTVEYDYAGDILNSLLLLTSTRLAKSGNENIAKSGNENIAKSGNENNLCLKFFI